MEQRIAQAEPRNHPQPKVLRMAPVLRGLIWATIGFVVFDLFTVAVDPYRGNPLVTEPSAVIGWVGGLLGWLLGVGGYEEMILPLFGSPSTWVEPKDWRRYFGLSTNHKVIGIQYLFSSSSIFLIAGLDAMAMRYELMQPSMHFFTYTGQYLTAVGIHGSLMMFGVGTVAMISGLGNYFVPLMIGAKRTVFSRLSGIGHWLLPAGALTLVASPLLGYWDTGWRGYEPLASQDPGGMVYYYLGIFAMTFSTILSAVNLSATIIFHRAKGMTWARLPLFVWGILTVSLLNLIWQPEIEMTFVMALLDKLIPFHFWDALGSPETYLSMFWLFGHPEVYIIVLPAFAMWNEIIPVMAQKNLFARDWAIIGLIFVMMLSGLVWAHHMFTNMRNSEMFPFAFFTEMISIPTGFSFMAAIGTLWKARLRLTTPSLLVLMSLFNFVIGGLTGVYLADPPVNLQVHDTFFVIAHFHYTIIGGMIFTWIASMYYWLPKFSGRMYNETWGKLLAIWIFIGFNGTFGQMFLLGLDGMNRWVPAYPPYLKPVNYEVSLFAFFLGAGFIAHAIHIIWAWRNGPKAPENPWHSRTLEWLTTSPPPENNFDGEVEVVRGFYRYDHDEPSAYLVKNASESQ
ncbi:cytochrome c oxidase subunit I [Sulfobacillus thermosulfidooxidans]|uniref:cytochrome c oxidase subunit I n=1 Tax=Sulfobacillus thermosulfidooxidans TaxID=28034 RepID=UPI00096BB205|nr:cbb3-type cytochrome c oxidase subunit I [Sulfobacillus thermosulfidooxidans]OLZ10976.1 cytochrome C oxidase subunit I [Sulfobacillus thermosulfidooxidans]OLZ14464.1 cytochrome C oxidase subunit I [Sulfobacillus thermosulfidooxidans]OLZ19207.1 cytochrome C oxidase subunit I [Sulfobacillus thermosulfidooxidans]